MSRFFTVFRRIALLHPSPRQSILLQRLFTNLLLYHPVTQQRNAAYPALFRLSNPRLRAANPSPDTLQRSEL
jgi:hypothetical protein